MGITVEYIVAIHTDDGVLVTGVVADNPKSAATSALEGLPREVYESLSDYALVQVIELGDPTTSTT